MAKKLAIVTGSSSGLGRAITQGLLERRYTVVGVARRDPEFQHPSYYHHSVDLSIPTAVESWARTALDPLIASGDFHRLVLVNNAGRVGPVALAESLDAEELQTTMQLNATTPIWLMGHLIARASAQDLRIANISSGAAVKPYAGWSAYCASKAALRMAGMVAAEEFERVYRERDPQRRLAIISYSPGVVDTPMQRELRKASVAQFPDRERFVDLHESGELVAPEETGEFLCSLLDEDSPPDYCEPRYS